MKIPFVLFLKFIIFPICHLFVEKIEGIENIPKSENFILVSNHINGKDHYYLGIPLRERLRDLRFLGAMDSLAIFLQSRILYYFANTIIVNRKNVDRNTILNKMTNCLKKGKIVVIYPEGTTNSKPELLKGKTGAVDLALKSGFPIVPVGISLSKNPFFKKRGIKIGEIIRFEEEKKEAANLNFTGEKYAFLIRETTDKIMKEISMLSKKPYPHAN
jgi:1-acyl-sn-glycerol-3-phosphate acyltransferase